LPIIAKSLTNVKPFFKKFFIFFYFSF